MSSINVVTANTFTSTTQSRQELLTKLTLKEQKMFKEFVKSVLGGKL